MANNPNPLIKTGSTDVDGLAEQANAAVEKAVQRGSFSVLSYISNGGVVMPTDTVDIYTDVEANYLINEIDRERDRLFQMSKGSIAGPPPEEMQPLEERRAALAERNENSHFVFHLRGVHPAVNDEIVRSIQKKIKAAEIGDTDNDWAEAMNCERLAKSVVKVVHAATGEVDDHVFTADEAGDLLTNLPRSEAKKLIDTSSYLSLGVALGDHRVDAGFPGRGTHLAGKPSDTAGAEGGDRLG